MKHDPQPVPDPLKERLRAVQIQAGLSIRSFAAALGVNHQNLLRWYQPQTVIPASFVAKVAETFRVEAGWLLTGRGAAGDVVMTEAQIRTVEGYLDAAVEAGGKAGGLARLARAHLRMARKPALPLDDLARAHFAEGPDAVRDAALRHLMGTAQDREEGTDGSEDR